jgi:hypothetical protein
LIVSLNDYFMFELRRIALGRAADIVLRSEVEVFGFRHVCAVPDRGASAVGYLPNSGI